MINGRGAFVGISWNSKGVGTKISKGEINFQNF